MIDEFKNKFWSNLKITSKFICIVIVGISIKIIFDAVHDESKEDLFFPLYFLVFLPVMILGVFTYTKLKICSLNRYICSVIFGSVISVSTIILYIVANILDATDINIRLAQFFVAIIFVTASLIYLQLPWESEA
ncbi:hypothetical protein J8Z24_08335 [Pseudoalteromonas sp. SCSIO 43201]|uniref:hypothetical protein n=1 Tax=Pseudoalteromonas sp. SCSIO 43201 TaxID=2822842 RepID=UPI00207620C0|nr:hypothetical protein [Pseudoalteromonas sp. SCSIO 43201]USD30063.1 hypothetical protein J8Z24_08335 [Pseudoalteromonas sp. SCSIO 43201]